MANGSTSAWRDVSYNYRNLPIAEIKGLVIGFVYYIKLQRDINT